MVSKLQRRALNASVRWRSGRRVGSCPVLRLTVTLHLQALSHCLYADFRSFRSTWEAHSILSGPGSVLGSSEGFKVNWTLLSASSASSSWFSCWTSFIISSGSFSSGIARQSFCTSSFKSLGINLLLHELRATRLHSPCSLPILRCNFPRPAFTFRENRVSVLFDKFLNGFEWNSCNRYFPRRHRSSSSMWAA